MTVKFLQAKDIGLLVFDELKYFVAGVQGIFKRGVEEVKKPYVVTQYFEAFGSW